MRDRKLGRETVKERQGDRHREIKTGGRDSETEKDRERERGGFTL